MIIVPTEKRFDWSHAPVVLFCIVILNVLIYFLYQSGDDRKMSYAINAYEKSNYFELEWPYFQSYLELHKETELLNHYRKQHEDRFNNQIKMDLLLRADFLAYVQDKARTQLGDSLYEQWEFQRTLIDKKIKSLSHLAHGLSAANFKVSALITHQFLHGGLMHLLGNMFFLVLCGFAVEAAIGHWRFLLFYLLSGVAAGYAQMSTDWQSTTPLIGASGAISGVMAMYLAVFRFKKIEFFYWFFFFVGYVRLPALVILPFYIGKEVYSFYNDAGSHVAFMAHAGGFVAGALLIGGALLFNRSMLNIDYIETDQNIDSHRQALANIYDLISKHRFDKALMMTHEAIKENGLNIELATIRYNLTKIAKGDAFVQAAVDLLGVPLSSASDVKRLAKIWVDTPDAHGKLDEKNTLRLGIQFVSLETPDVAEQVFNELLKRNCKNPSMSVFATKLSMAYGALHNTAKKMQYESTALGFTQAQLQGV